MQDGRQAVKETNNFHYSNLNIWSFRDSRITCKLTHSLIFCFVFVLLVAGVLFIRVHKGISLIPMDSSGTSDPYVMIFANSDIVCTFNYFSLFLQHTNLLEVDLFKDNFFSLKIPQNLEHWTISTFLVDWVNIYF